MRQNFLRRADPPEDLSEKQNAVLAESKVAWHRDRSSSQSASDQSGLPALNNQSPTYEKLKSVFPTWL